jgi:hypothetical protein
MIMRHWVLTSMAIVASIGSGVGHAGDLNIRIILAGQIAPGVYGQVDLGDEAPPPLVYAEPVLIVRVATPLPPVYLYVPPRHARNWGRYCRQYNACSRPVYFVLSPEYQPVYVRGDYGDDGYYWDEEHHYRDEEHHHRDEEHHHRHGHDDDHEHDENNDD